MDALFNVWFLSLFVAHARAYYQFVNNNTVAVSSSTYSDYVASRAVDGDTDQNGSSCSHTDDKTGIKEAWLRIDLWREYSVKSVKIWYRGDRGSTISTIRLLGYSLRVSNDITLPPKESSCYTDPGNVALPTVVEEDCERTARYIWIYQSKKPKNEPCPMLEICEVEVYGCNAGYYGPECKGKCDYCRNNATCGAKTGKCECKHGTYGLNCTKKCSRFCMNDDCHGANGICSLGCEIGYKGNTCNKTCEEKTYGPNCSKTCGNCLNDEVCHHVNGTCPDGCVAGYKTHNCNTTCNDGEYGVNCLSSCSGHCINGEACNKTDGSCRACEAGYKERNCNKTCGAGMYGQNCSLFCGACLNSTPCNYINGSCEMGCEPGWKNTGTCQTDCPDGTFGLDCMYNCSGHCLDGEYCNKTDGTCQGCSAGWETPSCNKTCDVGWYGSNCNNQCGYCTVDDICHHVNGRCPGSCREGYTGHNCSTRVLLIEGYSLDSEAIILIVFPLAGVSLIVTCVVTLVFLLRKRGTKTGKERNDVLQEIEDQEDEESPEILDDTVLYTTVQIRSKSIKIADLLSVIRALEKDTDKGFTEEFNSIPYGEQSDINCTVGKLPENVPKNRFKTTFPYDHSRVVLQSSKTGDYINANFIKNTEDDVVYIASQGPKPKTVGDFWQMVWQENVFVIAMVTNLKEGEKIKCERYWPTSVDKNVVLETHTIRLFSERTYANFSTHNLKLINKETQESRQITHLQYTSWPDHGTPNPLELLSFYHYVSRAMQQHPEEKLVVHCSAGIGRTGTFIALDALYRQGMKKGKINIVEYVHKMREDRMNMIQNLNQYKFLYHALCESLRTGCHVLRKEDFVQEVDSQMKSDKATNLSNFRTEFKEFDSMRKIFEESEKQIGIQNAVLNMTNTVLPADKMRIILTSHVPDRGTYYNAVPISTFTAKDCIIAGQYPVQGAAVDLIRLLVDQDCTSLVLTHPLSDLPHSGAWFSGSLYDYRVDVGPVTKISPVVNKYTVRIKPPSSKGWHKVSMYEILTWNPTENLQQILLDTVKRIQLYELVDPEHKITILSRDGASRCGEFCAVYNAIQQLQQDHKVDMFAIVRQLQSRRPEMISDLNEYLLCCKVVADFIKTESEDTYMNSACNTGAIEENFYANT